MPALTGLTATMCTTDCHTTTVDADRRLEFWQHAGELYGLPLSDEQLAETERLDDLAVVDRFFPTLSDPERSEVLWSLGAYLSG